MTTPNVEILPKEPQEFSPTRAMREVKARFMLRFAKKGQFYEQVRLQDVETIIPDARIRKWWQIPGFKEWFLDGEDFEVACELAAQEALLACREIVQDSSQKGTARVAAAKLIMTIAKKTQNKENESGDETIKQLAQNPQQLREFLRASIRRTFSRQELLKLVEANSEDN